MLSFLSIISAALLVSGSPAGLKPQMAVHEQRTAPPGFARVGKPSTGTIDLRIALVPQDIDGLEKALFDVSTPGNALYGQHLSLDEVSYQWLA